MEQVKGFITHSCDSSSLFSNINEFSEEIAHEVFAHWLLPSQFKDNGCALHCIAFAANLLADHHVHISDSDTKLIRSIIHCCLNSSDAFGTVSSHQQSLLELQQSAVSLTTISQEPEGFQQGISLDKDCVESQQKQGVVHVPESDLVQAVRSGEVNVIIALANSIHIFDAGLGFLVGSFREVIDVDSASPESRYGTARICQVKVKGVLGPCIILAYGLNDLSSPINIQKFRSAITSARHILNNKVLSVDSEFSFKRPICVGTYPMGAMSKNRISPKTSIEII